MDYNTVMADIARHDREFGKPPRQKRRRTDPEYNCGPINWPSLPAFSPLWIRRLSLLLAGLLFLLVMIAAPLSWYQTDLIYWNHVPTMAESMRKHPEWKIKRYFSQGSSQYAAYVLKGKPSKPTVIYMHGRGENMDIVTINVSPYRFAGWTVIVPEYPGFAGLAGTPSESGFSILMGKVYQDVVQQGTFIGTLVIHGNSLGAGPALQMAQNPHGMLVLTAPVATLDRMMDHFAPVYPTFLLRDHWDNLARARTRHPVSAIVFHSTEDPVVPYDQGEDMARATSGELVTYDRYGHAVAGAGAAYVVRRYLDHVEAVRAAEAAK